MTSPITLDHCRALDAQDPLRALRDQFNIPDGLIYLDGNSLGVLPRSVAARVADVVQREWGQDLIRSWNSAGWFEMPQRVGDKVARLISAGAGQVVATDSTSVNLFKVPSAALHLQHQDAPARRVCCPSAATSPPTCTSPRRCAANADARCSWWSRMRLQAPSPATWRC